MYAIRSYYVYALETYPATETALSLDILRTVFEKTAGEPFVLDKLTAAPLPAVVIPPKRLKEIRRDFYQALRREADGKNVQRRRQHRHAALDTLLPAGGQQPADKKLISVTVRDASYNFV